MNYKGFRISDVFFVIYAGMENGKFYGTQLMKQAMNFCKEENYQSVYLWTFQGLESARHLYEKFGFSLTEERTGTQWGSKVTEQRFDAEL